MSKTTNIYYIRGKMSYFINFYIKNSILKENAKVLLTTVNFSYFLFSYFLYLCT